jgi:hypothetical protein
MLESAADAVAREIDANDNVAALGRP